MDFSALISSRVGIDARQVAATVALLNDKATIPFIARYRKEKTGSLDEVQIGAIADEYHRLLELDDRKQTILDTIEGQGKMTPELRRRIEASWDATELEDIYLPYKPHRKTRADVAREQGLEPLAKILWKQEAARPDGHAILSLNGLVRTSLYALLCGVSLVTRLLSQPRS